MNIGKISKCKICDEADKEVANQNMMERPKVMRNPDNSWNCPMCNTKNENNVIYFKAIKLNCYDKLYVWVKFAGS